MSYFNQLYLEKQKQLEANAETSKHNNGIQARFVANKFVDRYLKEFDEFDLPLNSMRLNYLVQLVDLIFRSQNGGNLFCDDYIVTSNGLAILSLLYGYSYLTEDRQVARSYLLHYETEYQIKYKSFVGNELNDKIDFLVKKVLLGTRYIETDRLKFMLNFKNIQQTKFNCLEFENYQLPQEVIAKLFKDFDFTKFEELNEKQKTKFQNI